MFGVLYFILPNEMSDSTVAQKGHRYFSTIVCIFPAYYNFLKKHFDFVLLFPPGWKVFPLGWKVFPPGWKVFPPGWKVFPPGWKVKLTVTAPYGNSNAKLRGYLLLVPNTRNLVMSLDILKCPIGIT